jgi:hypothetical protein
MPPVLIAEVKIVWIAVISVVAIVCVVSLVAVSGISAGLCLRGSSAHRGGKNRHHDQPGKSTCR